VVCVTTAPPRSALLVAWGRAWLAGEAALPELAGRAHARDAAAGVVGLERALVLESAAGLPPAEPRPAQDEPLDRAMGRLRASGVERLRLVLPVPGDALGLPGPGGFSAAALACGEGVLALRSDGSGVGLVPAVTTHGSEADGIVTTVRWTAHPVQASPVDPGPFLPDAEHDLRAGVLDCLSVLTALDVARWRPDVAQALDDLRRQTRQGIGGDELPRAYPARARELLVRARSLSAVVALASGDAGGAVDTRESVAREQALRELGRHVRRAQLAAYNA